MDILDILVDVAKINKNKLIEMEAQAINAQRSINALIESVYPEYSPRRFNPFEQSAMLELYNIIRDKDIIGNFFSEIDRIWVDLVSFFDDSMVEVFSTNIGLLEGCLNFFHNSSIISKNTSHPVRICLKINAEKNGNIEIYDLFRDYKYTYSPSSVLSSLFPPFDMTKNSGFEEVSTGGKGHYICNNIPEEFKRGKYKNRRIIEVMANAYVPKEDHGDEVDPDWIACWDMTGVDGKNIKDARACYKSTVILPIYFGGAQSDKLKNIWVGSGNIDGKRLVYAYLCMDHILIDYFSPRDISLAKFAAENMSVFFFLRERWRGQSHTFKIAEALVRQYAKSA